MVVPQRALRVVSRPMVKKDWVRFIPEKYISFGG